MSQPFLHETPIELLRQLTQQSVTIGDRTFHLTHPVDIDPLLDHPATLSAFEADEYLPYWATLWPSAQLLGQALIAAQWPAETVALEIGCGLGLSGIVALSLGLRVIFSDYDRAALQFAVLNAQANGFDNFEACPIDWRCPPDDLKVPLLLAADILYEARSIEPVTRLIPQLLAPGGECWLVDPDRSYAQNFRRALTQQGLIFSQTPMQLPGKPPVNATLAARLEVVRGSWKELLNSFPVSVQTDVRLGMAST
jgi:predicted nicotinamide N-methyase